MCFAFIVWVWEHVLGKRIINQHIHNSLFPVSLKWCISIALFYRLFGISTTLLVDHFFIKSSNSPVVLKKIFSFIVPNPLNMFNSLRIKELIKLTNKWTLKKEGKKCNAKKMVESFLFLSAYIYCPTIVPLFLAFFFNIFFFVFFINNFIKMNIMFSLSWTFFHWVVFLSCVCTFHLTNERTQMKCYLWFMNEFGLSARRLFAVLRREAK